MTIERRLHLPQLIERKRDGGMLLSEEIREIVEAFTRGDLPDYQMSALAMAIYFRGLSEVETATLTAAMRDSGRVFHWPEGSPPKVDKHSTGGVGDKVSLVLAPLLACDHLWVPMVAGRGLGITGGTLDKLESIPGFNVNLSEDACLAQIKKLGVFMAGQTDDFCPADKKLYALRDVTGTVPSRELIIASIMSKKLAESLDRLVLDVKFGPGAFMKTKAAAEKLAQGLQFAGQESNVITHYHLTPMEEPLGQTVGNALEVFEAVETLQGRGPADLVKLVLDLSEKVADVDRAQLETWLKDGTAWRKFTQLVQAQGGDATALERITRIHRTPVVVPFPADQSGTLQKIDAGILGAVSVQLGAGRRKATDSIDAAVGFSAIRKCGETMEKGEPVFLIHAREESALAPALHALHAAVRIEA